MENVKNRRFHKRLPLKLNVLCQTVGLSGGRAYTGSTIDVSSGGMLVEINDGRLNEGQLLSVEMSVPPTTGLLEYGGRFSSYARVCRTDIDRSEFPDSNARAVALEFCDSPQLRI
jgi:hypothetical protein